MLSVTVLRTTLILTNMSTQIQEPKVLTPDEFAQLFRVHGSTVGRRIIQGRIQSIRLPGGGYRIPAVEDILRMWKGSKFRRKIGSVPPKCAMRNRPLPHFSLGRAFVC